MRRDVRSRLLGLTALGGAVGAQVEGAHVELISHIEWGWTRVGGQEGNQVVRAEMRIVSEG